MSISSVCDLCHEYNNVYKYVYKYVYTCVKEYSQRFLHIIVSTVYSHDESQEILEILDEDTLTKELAYKGTSGLSKWLKKGYPNHVSNHICCSDSQDMFTAHDDCCDEVFLKEDDATEINDDSKESTEANDDPKDDSTHPNVTANHAKDKYKIKYSSELNQNESFQMPSKNVHDENANVLSTSQMLLKISTNYDNNQPLVHVMSCDVQHFNEVNNDMFLALTAAMMIASLTVVHFVINIILLDNISIFTTDFITPEPGINDVMEEVFSDVIEDATDVSAYTADASNNPDVIEIAAIEDEKMLAAHDDVTKDNPNDELDADTSHVMFQSQCDVTNVCGQDLDLVSVVWSQWSDPNAGKSILFIIFDSFLPQHFHEISCQMIVSDNENDAHDSHGNPTGVDELPPGAGPRDDLLQGGPKGNVPAEDGDGDGSHLLNPEVPL